jgi:hypothetical protein
MADTGLLNNLHRGKLALIVGSLTVITSFPQLYLCYTRGHQWNGSCAYLDTDELAYAAYINALIDGRPRRSDPYTGNDNNRGETLFSIQFLPAYVTALIARLLRISAASVFILLTPVVTVAATLIVFWLLREVSNNLPLSTIGAVGVLCLGTVASYNPVQFVTSGQAGYDVFPFLRRYIPAVPFPVLVGFFIFTWRALTRNRSWTFAAAACFAFLVYSYFFLWTTAAAWFCAITAQWFLVRSEERRSTLQVFGTMTTLAGISLSPYLWLLMHRAVTIDRAQLLEQTHAPDLLRAPELCGAILLGLVAFKGRHVLARDARLLFASSFAIVPFLIFNQQILTGRSLQAFHYEEFVTNYMVVIAYFITLGVARPNLPRRLLAYVTVGTVFMGIVLTVSATRSTLAFNIEIDRVRGAALTLRQEGKNGVVFAPDSVLTHTIPSVSGNPVLWARHLYTFANTDLAGQRKRFYEYLYYSGFDEERLLTALRNDFGTRWELFGAERANPVLVSRQSPITEDEIYLTAKEYAKFVSSFDITTATEPTLSYAVVSRTDDLTNLDRWYERDAGEQAGDFIIYRLKLKNMR